MNKVEGGKGQRKPHIKCEESPAGVTNANKVPPLRKDIAEISDSTRDRLTGRTETELDGQG